MSRVDEALQPAATAPIPLDAPGPLASLYEEDEVAWLERSAEMIRAGDIKGLDFPHLAEFLEDMAIAQRREVKSRLATLLLHLLKWTYQPERRGVSWLRTIHEQRRELEILFETKTLRRHGEAILQEAYTMSAKYAGKETRLSSSTFPSECPYSLDEAISLQLDEEGADRE